MPIDLHLHSTASDGTDDPATLVARATDAGLEVIALTDHDTQEGIQSARTAAVETGIDLIPGVELSLSYHDGGMHLLVLWLEPGAGPLQDRLHGLQLGRRERNSRIVDLLCAAGLPLTIEEVLEEAGGGSVGRPHIAAVMVARGYVPDIRVAFDQWLGNGRPAYVSRDRLEPEEAIALARESGAVPVLAHPHTLGIHTSGEMADMLTRLKSAGLIGLEALYSSYRRHERDGYVDLAHRFDLVPTGGSDYHGAYKEGLSIGTGYGDLAVPASVMDGLLPFVGVS
ncbi:MAG TPA: PHP domain-containing protein [Acidimicrobiia bacterium]|nr:PHP domain-containing protein [Acidimicrobiia bacterium]